MNILKTDITFSWFELLSETRPQDKGFIVGDGELTSKGSISFIFLFFLYLFIYL